MTFLHQVIDWFNVEKVKAIAALVQAFGFLLAAGLTYRYTRKLESHKFDIKLNEIRFSKLYDKRLEATEGIHGKLIVVIQTASNITAFFQTIPEVEGKSLEERIEVDLLEKVQRFYDAVNELGHFFNQRSIYFPQGICKEITELVRNLTITIKSHHFLSTFKNLPPKERSDKWMETEAKVRDAVGIRDKLEEQFRELLDREGLLDSVEGAAKN